MSPAHNFLLLREIDLLLGYDGATNKTREMIERAAVAEVVEVLGGNRPEFLHQVSKGLLPGDVPKKLSDGVRLASKMMEHVLFPELRDHVATARGLAEAGMHSVRVKIGAAAQRAALMAMTCAERVKDGLDCSKEAVFKDYQTRLGQFAHEQDQMIRAEDSGWER